ncbi:hypothetical protein B0H10DRAFT_2221809 [Mycena sp. CBHHK59/15]|nr:hypothetical protein B0H10DRAFT_2221809 [Mycena sp. CBHHK59/15]
MPVAFISVAMSLYAYPNPTAAYVNLNFPAMDTMHSDYAPYHNAGQVPSAFAAGSSPSADHIEHPTQRPPRYFARGTQLGPPSSVAPRYSGTSSSATAPARYATGVPISGYGPAAYLSRPAGRAWEQDGPASADDVQGLAVHGHASEGLLPLRYSAAAFSATSPAISSSSCSTASGSGVFKSGAGVVLASPTPQVPYPAPTMAILLNNGGEQQRQQETYGGSALPTHYGNLRMPPAHAMMYPDTMTRTVAEGDLDGGGDALEEGFLSREKKHGCTMCHKRSACVSSFMFPSVDDMYECRFDRPSTLKKHLLVHTGEKAFQCPICERRFGVMSNLNRHIRRCSLREVHMHGSGAAASTASASSPGSPVVMGKRGRTPPPADPASGAATAGPTPRKRRRRPPSPSRWVPASLRAFTILPPEVTAPAPVPLHPVSPSRALGPICDDADGALPWDEERDSWDENVGSAPYHPRDWAKTHRLPGPGIVKFGGAVGGNYSGDTELRYGNQMRSRVVMV